MVNQWSSFSTTPPLGSLNTETQLDAYDFTNYNANTSIWVGILYCLLMALLVYYVLRPKHSLLKKVKNANQLIDKDVVDIMDRESIADEVIRGSFKLIVRDSIISGVSHPNNDFYRRFFEDETSPPLDNAVDATEDAGIPSRDVSYYQRQTESKEGLNKAQGISITFLNLKYSVKSSRLGDTGLVELLKGIDGHLKPGDMCALMGASGTPNYSLVDIYRHILITNTSALIYIS